ncbi:BNR-4 repeat-containing protein [Halosimplex aquaticum]
MISENAGRKSAHDKQNPQAVYAPGEDTTFVVFRGESADPYATYYDHEGGEIGPEVRIGTNPIPDDDTHGAPALTIDDEGFLHVFYGVHNDPLSYAKSEAPYDTSAWEPMGQPMAEADDDILASDYWETDRALLSVPGGTYTFPLTYQSYIYLLYRTGTEPNAHGPDPEQGDQITYPSHAFATILRSTDGGETWDDIGPVIDTRGARGRPESDAYVEDFDERDGKLHITWTVATGDPDSQPPRGHDGPRRGGYHAYYDTEDGLLYDLAGNQYGSTITWDDHSDGALRLADDEYTTRSGWVYKHLLTDDTVVVVFQSTDNFGIPDGKSQHVLATYDDGWAFERIPGSYTASNHSHVRTSDDGRLEAHLLTETDEGGERASDYSVLTRSDGEWTQEVLLEAEPIEGINTVRNGTDEFAALANGIASDRPQFSKRLWAVGTFSG